MKEINDVLYIGQTPGMNNIDVYHQNTISRDIFIDGTSNGLFAGPITVTSTITVQSGGTLVII